MCRVGTGLAGGQDKAHTDRAGQGRYPFLGALAGRNRVVLTANDSAAQQFETAFPEYLIKAFGDEGADTMRTARSRGSWERLRREQAKAADATNGRHRPLGLRRKWQSNRRQNHKRGDGCNNILVIVVRDVVLRLLRRRPRRRRA